MKKTIISVLLVIVAIICLSACSTEDNVTPSQPNDTTTNTKSATTETNNPATSHTHSFSKWKTTKAATCTEPGEQERVCSCGEKEAQTIAATGHTVVTDPAVPATCTTDGKTEGSHCSVCKETIEQQKTIAAKGHTIVKDSEIAATCTTDGKTEGSHCSVCGEVIQAQQTVPASHDVQYGICKNCNEIIDEEAAINHYISISSNANYGIFTTYYDGSPMVKYTFSTAFPDISIAKAYDGQLMIGVTVEFATQIYSTGNYFSGTGFVSYEVYNNNSYLKGGKVSISGYGGGLARVTFSVKIPSIEMCNFEIYFDDYSI